VGTETQSVATVIDFEKQQVRIDVTDTTASSDAEMLRLLPQAIEGAQGIILAFSLESTQQLVDIETQYVPIIRQHTSAPMVLMGTFGDRVQSTDAVNRYNLCEEAGERLSQRGGQRRGVPFVPTSAQFGQNINMVFLKTVEEVVNFRKSTLVATPMVEPPSKSDTEKIQQRTGSFLGRIASITSFFRRSRPPPAQRPVSVREQQMHDLVRDEDCVIAPEDLQLSNAVVGKGGFGVVKRGRHLGVRSILVLKVLGGGFVFVFLSSSLTRFGFFAAPDYRCCRQDHQQSSRIHRRPSVRRVFQGDSPLDETSSPDDCGSDWVLLQERYLLLSYRLCEDVCSCCCACCVVRLTRMPAEYIDGGDMSRYLYSDEEAFEPRLFTPEHQLAVAKSVVAGMVFLHAKKVIHRDLKPGKYVLTFYSCVLVRVADIGC
jgi:Ras family/Protein tyrosine and serine/threonine kinase